MARKPLTSFADLASRLRCVFGDLWTGRSADAAALDCLNTWPDPALLTDSSFRLLAANTAFAALVNDTDELLARKTSLPDVLRAWTASSLSAGNDVAAALQAAGDCEYLLHYHAQPYRVRQRRMANGALMLVFSAEAERRRLQGALADAETRHGILVDQLPVGIVLSDASDGRILEINTAARQTLGLPEDIELAALCVSDFYAHADERQSVDKALRQRSGVEERTITLRRFDGLMSSVSLSAKKLGQPGARVVLSAINDVSALQRSTESLQVREKSLHSIVDQLPVAAWLCRPSDGHVLLANNLAHQILDRPNHVLVGGVMPDIFANPNARAKVDSELAVRGRFQNLELHLHMPRLATTRYYLLSATPVEFAGQSALLYSAIDIETQRQREEVLLSARSEAEIATRKLREVNAELEQAASIDRLTRAHNRRHFEEVALREMGRSRRYKMPLSLIMFDIDHFKHINDDFGHALGDVILREFVQLLQGRVRTSDVLARWGGEEFVILAPFTSLEEARGVAEKLRDCIAEHTFTEVGSVSASVGVTDLHYRDTFDSLLQRADRALATAKAEGRNQVVATPAVTA